MGAYKDKRKDRLTNIGEWLAAYSIDIREKAKENDLSGAIYAENNIRDLLNCLKGWNLVNGNHEKQNMPGIDLIDREEKICIQITITKTAQKIRNSLEKTHTFLKDEEDWQYKILFLSEEDEEIKKLKKRDDLRDEILGFDPASDIWDFTRIRKDIAELGISKLENLYQLCCKMFENVAEEITTDHTLKSNWYHNTDPIFGRENELIQIQKMLRRQGRQGSSRLLFIRGMGGIGKSVLAEEYAYQHQEEYDVIFEVSAQSFETVIRSAWSNMNGNTNIDIQMQLNGVREELRTRRTLIIVHDYNVAEDKKAKWHSLPCDMLITTWNDKHFIGKQIYIKATDLDVENAQRIMRYYYVSADDTDIKAIQEQKFDSNPEAVRELIEKVERHPLTIKLLAKQMVCMVDKMITPAQMIEGLNDRLIVQDKSRYSNTHNAAELSETVNSNTIGHLKGVFEAAIKNGRLNTEQLQALRYMTMVDSVRGIGRNRFANWTRLDGTILNELERSGWIYFNINGYDNLDIEEAEETGTFHMPMVMGVVLTSMENLECYVGNSETYISGLREIKDILFTNYAFCSAVREQWMLIASRIHEEETAEYASFINDAGYYIEYLKENPAHQKLALACKEKALEIRKRVLGEMHADTGGSYDAVGYAYGSMNDFSTALKYSVIGLRIRRETLGENHADTAQSYNNVGAIAGYMRDLKTSLQYKKKALEIWQQVLGEDHADTATGYNNVGCVYEMLGDLENGIAYQEKGLEIRRKVLGENNIYTAQSYSNVGEVYGKLGQKSKELEYQLKALEIRQKILGE